MSCGLSDHLPDRSWIKFYVKQSGVMVERVAEVAELALKCIMQIKCPLTVPIIVVHRFYNGVIAAVYQKTNLCSSSSRKSARLAN